MFKLALALGKTVGEIERTMTVSELTEWLHVYGEEPFGDVRADLRAGIIAREIRMCLSQSRKQWSPLDFMPIVRKQLERIREAQARATSPREVAEGIKAMFFRLSKGKLVERPNPRAKVKRNG